jgi:DedD protein
MESKTKHRILGVVVVAGIAVLAYPFIQGSSSMPGEQALVKAPPFPDQTIQVASTDEAVSGPAATDTQSTTPVPDSSLNANNNVPVANSNPVDTGTPAVTNVAAPEDKTASSPDVKSPEQSSMAPADTMAAPAPQADSGQSVNGNEMSAADSTSAPAMQDETAAPTNATTTNDNEPATKAVMTQDTTSVPAAKKHHKTHAKAPKKNHPVIQSKLTTASAITANRHRPVDSNGLMQLKQAAWVVQIGSFKQKSNALKLVNRLRAKGYRAFIQHVASGAGQTRVFVGPEHKQDSARLLASELQSEMKLHGIVISYKPFTL